MRTKPILSSLATVIAVALITCTAPEAECRLEPGPRRTVTQVLDGETLRLDDGSEVRLVGALAPRGYDAGMPDAEWPAAVAATVKLKALVDGRTVVLGYLGAHRRDRQNRHLAQVFVIADKDETWVQGHMLSSGHARASQQRDVRGCAEELLAHEQVARQAGLGVWSIAAYQIRLANRPRDLEGMGERFAVLTGRVAWIAESRDSIMLGFSSSRIARWQSRRGVVVMIDGRDRDLIGALGGDIKALEGRDIDLRGWLEQRQGRPPGTFVVDVSTAGINTTASPVDTALSKSR